MIRVAIFNFPTCMFYNLLQFVIFRLHFPAFPAYCVVASAAMQYTQFRLNDIPSDSLRF